MGTHMALAVRRCHDTSTRASRSRALGDGTAPALQRRVISDAEVVQLARSSRGTSWYSAGQVLRTSGVQVQRGTGYSAVQVQRWVARGRCLPEREQRHNRRTG